MEIASVFSYNYGMPVPPKINFAQLCKQIRTEYGYTQQEMADRLGVHIRNYQKWEKGTGEPNAQASFRLAQMHYEKKFELIKKKIAQDLSKDIDEISPNKDIEQDQ